MLAPSSQSSDSGDRRPLAAHIWRKDPDGFYVEPQWCSERLFEVETFIGPVWDPCCGIGRIPEAARRAGHPIIATDVIDRGYYRFGGVADFLRCERRVRNIVCNPPFAAADQFVRRALKLATGKVAMIWLARRLNAARWLQHLPLARIYLLTPRPSMPPGHVIATGHGHLHRDKASEVPATRCTRGLTAERRTSCGWCGSDMRILGVDPGAVSGGQSTMARRKTELEQELTERATLPRAWRRWHREQLKDALAGMHGAVLERLMKQLKDLHSARALVDFIAAQDWTVIDFDTRLIALHQINTAITALRERRGLTPIDDPLPGQPENVFRIIKAIISSFPPNAGNHTEEVR
jgi:hypothetical protein